MDGRINDNVLLGVAYSYLNGNVRSDVGHKTVVRGNALSVYGDWSLDRWFVSGNLGYGRNDYDSTRHIAGSTAKGRYDGDVLSAGLVGGYGFKVTDALLVEPRVAARYASVSMDGFTEKGSSAALDTGSQRYETGEVGAGLRVAGNWPLGAGSLQPEAALMAWHDLIGDPVVQTSRYAAGSSAFSVTGASVARDSYEASLGVNYRVAALSVGASYNREARSGLDGQSVVVKAQYAF